MSSIPMSGVLSIYDFFTSSTVIYFVSIDGGDIKAFLR